MKNEKRRYTDIAGNAPLLDVPIFTRQQKIYCCFGYTVVMLVLALMGYWRQVEIIMFIITVSWMILQMDMMALKMSWLQEAIYQIYKNSANNDPEQPLPFGDDKSPDSVNDFGK